jgi:hypothetical protein
MTAKPITELKMNKPPIVDRLGDRLARIMPNTNTMTRTALSDR